MCEGGKSRGRRERRRGGGEVSGCWLRYVYVVQHNATDTTQPSPACVLTYPQDPAPPPPPPTPASLTPSYHKSPKRKTGASYRVYLVLSPDTATASSVGFGMQDQLLYESEEIRVEDDMDAACPEIVVEDSSAAPRTLAAAAAAAPAIISGVVALVFGAVAVMAA